MKFSRYLLSRSVALCCIIVGALLWCVLAALMGADAVLIAVTAAGVVFFVCVWLVCDYCCIRSRLKRLERLCGEIREGYLLGELLPRPVNAVEEAYFRVMKTVSRSAVSKTEEDRRAQEEYREYVERWTHEVKTPLTACSLMLANGNLRGLKAELKRAENLTENILYYARLRTAEKDTQIKRISVRAVVDGAIESEADLLLAARIGVTVEGDFSVCTDGSALSFVLKQLLVNCSKYCAGCHIDISVGDGRICLEDNGPGIPPHELPRIFSRGFVGAAGRVHGGGTGMGLYLAREVCRRVGVGLDAASEEGKYTRFLLTFPAAERLTKA